MQDVQESTWEQVALLDLRGRVFHREEAGDEVYGMMREINLTSRGSFEVIDDAGRSVAGGAADLCSCRIAQDGTITISIYLIGRFIIFPVGTRLTPA